MKIQDPRKADLLAFLKDISCRILFFSCLKPTEEPLLLVMDVCNPKLHWNSEANIQHSFGVLQSIPRARSCIGAPNAAYNIKVAILPTLSWG